MTGPGKDPLGATPMLPAPAGEPARRAREMFSAYLAEARAHKARSDAAPEARTRDAEPDRRRSATPPVAARSYELALSILLGTERDGPGATASTHASDASRPDASLDGEPSIPWVDPEDLAVHPSGAADLDGAANPRPPPGAATVRPSAPVPSVPPELDRGMLEGMAESAMLWSGVDGTTSFDIAFNDDVFDSLGCSIVIEDNEVIAVFRAEDRNTRRLLEAEAGRLRAQLEERGLRVREVRIVSE